MWVCSSSRPLRGWAETLSTTPCQDFHNFRYRVLTTYFEPLYHFRERDRENLEWPIFPTTVWPCKPELHQLTSYLILLQMGAHLVHRFSPTCTTELTLKTFPPSPEPWVSFFYFGEESFRNKRSALLRYHCTAYLAQIPPSLHHLRQVFIPILSCQSAGEAGFCSEREL